MGNGSFDGSKFSLFATFDFNATTSQINAWRAALSAASVSLFYATEGQISIGKIVASNNSSGVDKADLLLTKFSGDSGTYGTIVPQLPGNQTVLRRDERAHPGVILHELGHYLFSLKDEYLFSESGSTRTGHCTADPTGDSACVMEHSDQGDVLNLATGMVVNGSIRKFCCNANHTAENNQEVVNGESCWETIVNRWGSAGTWGTFSIVGPVSGTRPNGSPSGIMPDEIEWIDVTTHSRITCLLSDTETPATPAADLIQLFVSVLAQIDKDAEIRIFLPSSQASALDWQLKQAINQFPTIAAVQLHILTAEQLLREVNDLPAANQRMLFYGQPAQVLQSQVIDNAHVWAGRVSDAGILVHSLSATSSIQTISHKTNGVQRILLPAPDNAQRVTNVSQHLAAAFECNEHWGMIDDRLATFPSQKQPVQRDDQELARFSSADLQRVSEKSLTTEISAESFDFPVFVEEGAARVAFMISHPADTSVWLYVRTPQGDIVSLQTPGLVHTRQHEYQLYILSGKAVTGGQWTMRVERAAAARPMTVQVRAYAYNPLLRAHLCLASNGPLKSYDLALTMRYADLPISNLRPLAQLTDMTAAGKVTGTRLVELVQATDNEMTNGNYAYQAKITQGEHALTSVRLAVQNAGQAIQVVPRSHHHPSNEVAGLIPSFHRVSEAMLGD